MSSNRIKVKKGKKYTHYRLKLEIIMKKILDKYSNILFLGTGGGNDIFSSLYIADKMRGELKYSIAGMLSPAGTHYFNNKVEQCINELNTNVERYLGETKITFIDNMILELIDRYKYHPTKVFELSLKYGLTELDIQFNKLIQNEKFDCICFVDMGGDILGRKEDNTLLSPLLDFTCLYLSKNIKVDCMLIEFGLGTDGELRDGSINNIIDELQSNNLIIDKMKNSIDDSIIKFKNVFDDVSKVRLGYATYLTLSQIFNPEFNRDIQFKSSYQFDGNKWRYEFNSIISDKYVNEIFLIDIKKLLNYRNIIKYDSPFDFYIKMKKYNPNWKNEMDCHIIDNIIYCAISKQVDNSIRNDIISKCIKYSIDNNMKKILFNDDYTGDRNENIICI